MLVMRRIHNRNNAASPTIRCAQRALGVASDAWSPDAYPWVRD
jgi:hypothetical protein